MPAYRRPPLAGPLAPRRYATEPDPQGTETWAADDDFSTFERGADQLAQGAQPPSLTRQEKVRLVQESIPQALKDIGAAALSPNLKPGERSDLAKIAATLGVDLTSSLEGAQLAPWEKASMQETARLLGGRGAIEYTFDAQPGTDGGASMIKGVGRLQLNPEQLVSSQGVVDVAKLRATLAHEGRHFHDERTLGLTDQSDPQKWFTNLDQFRWTGENAARAEDALSKALGLKISEEPVDQRADDEVYVVRIKEPKLKEYGMVKRTGP